LGEFIGDMGRVIIREAKDSKTWRFFGSAFLFVAGLFLATAGTALLFEIWGYWNLLSIPVGVVVSLVALWWNFGYKEE